MKTLTHQAAKYLHQLMQYNLTAYQLKRYFGISNARAYINNRKQIDTVVWRL